MNVVDEFYHTIISIPSKELIQLLLDMKDQKEKEITLIKDKIIKYEEKRRAHEAWYQSLPALKKFFTGRPPSHHQAVEYLVNVKQRLGSIEEIKKRMTEIERVIETLRHEPERSEIVLSHQMIEEIKKIQEGRSDGNDRSSFAYRS